MEWSPLRELRGVGGAVERTYETREERDFGTLLPQVPFRVSCVERWTWRWKERPERTEDKRKTEEWRARWNQRVPAELGGAVET